MGYPVVGVGAGVLGGGDSGEAVCMGGGVGVIGEIGTKGGAIFGSSKVPEKIIIPENTMPIPATNKVTKTTAILPSIFYHLLIGTSLSP